jgi:hypothetical protein
MSLMRRGRRLLGMGVRGVLNGGLHVARQNPLGRKLAVGMRTLAPGVWARVRGRFGPPPETSQLPSPPLPPVPIWRCAESRFAEKIRRQI